METAREEPLSQPKAAFEIVAMAASAGGLNALSQVLSGLPAQFPAAIVIVQHLDPRHRSLMADILSRRTVLKVKQADEKDSLQPGMVYIAPPNRHLLVNSDGTLSLTQSELVHFVRPSADLLFDSVAASYQNRAIAVVLSGTGNDGGMGVQAIKQMGGTVIAQDEATSEFFGMPSTAIQTGTVDFILPLPEIAAALATLVMQRDT
ncbi:MAG: chemotaxis protein CheB [Leptolyngbyaceae cyanobacterium bins.302]|nr:chemotaxis protein CheB [Leptolyngbyaceae cyanobacterium bins.302]